MIYFNIFLAAVFLFISSARGLYFIQLKEYRFDRFYDFLKHERGATKHTPKTIFLFYFILISNLYFQSSVLLAVSLFYAILAYSALAFLKGFLRPKPTTKAKLIFVLGYLPPLLGSYFATEISLILAPLWMFLVVIAFMPITNKAKRQKIKQATRNREMYPKLKVIGITGSFGKSSTKEFLYHLLKNQVQTLKTPKNINTEIGVANHLIQNLKDTHQVYIVEMGAYRPGEIQIICDMVQPELGIITAIAPQHFTLFKTLENIKNTKAELVRSLPQKSLAILNADYPACQEIASNLSTPVFTYSKTQIQGDSFQVDGHTYTSQLEAAFLLPNLIAAVKAALYIGLKPEEIQSAIDTIPPEMLPIKLLRKPKALLVDDSYNSNPVGFAQAINLAKHQKNRRRKVLITRGMIELGGLSYEEHFKIAQLADEVFDEVIITHHQNFSPFQAGLKKAKLILLKDPKDVVEHLKNTLDPKDLILLENRIYPLILNYLKN